SSGCEDLYLKVFLGCKVSSTSASSPSDSGEVSEAVVSSNVSELTTGSEISIGSEMLTGSESSSSDT
ncbi:hypothetical protein A2U01_0067668, partial [Trifolium medium]|nr:hypothetical protein [Trifolium medium]